MRLLCRHVTLNTGLVEFKLVLGDDTNQIAGFRPYRTITPQDVLCP